MFVCFVHSILAVQCWKVDYGLNIFKLLCHFAKTEDAW